MAHYEVEIKSLLGGKEHADALLARMYAQDAATALTSRNKQLNHYFEGGDVGVLAENVQDLFDETAQKKLAMMVEKGKNFSVRTRERDGEVLLVLKASVDEGTSSNTVSRLEFEEPVTLALSDLDQKVLDAGFRYQAKWSREREEYTYKDIAVCLDRNAGYGYLAEFEKVADLEADVLQVRAEIEALMAELGVAELPQDRLERMFAHYNQNWPEYYGTDKIFVIE